MEEYTMKLTEDQARAKYGNDLINKVLGADWDLTGRLIYPAFEPEHAGKMELKTQLAESPVQAVCFMDEDADLEYDFDGVPEYFIDYD